MTRAEKGRVARFSKNELNRLLYSKRQAMQRTSGEPGANLWRAWSEPLASLERQLQGDGRGGVVALMRACFAAHRR